MSLESLSTYRVKPNEHVDYMKSVPLSEVTFKEETLALHAADDNGVLQVLEGAESIPTAQILADMQDAEICIVEIDEEKVGYFIGNQANGFYLGPEVDLEFLKENKPEVFEDIKTEGTGIGGAQPQMQPQLAATPANPGGGGNMIQSSAQGQMQGQIQGQAQGQAQGQVAGGAPPVGAGGGAGVGNMSMADLMAMVKAQREQKNTQGGGNDGGDQGGGQGTPPAG